MEQPWSHDLLLQVHQIHLQQVRQNQCSQAARQKLELGQKQACWQQLGQMLEHFAQMLWWMRQREMLQLDQMRE